MMSLVLSFSSRQRLAFATAILFLAFASGLTHDATNDTGSSATDNVTSNKKPTFSGKGEPGATVKVTVDGQEITAIVDGNGNWTTPALTTELSNGNKTVSILLTDKAGNTKTVTSNFTIDAAAPTPVVNPEDPANPPAGKTGITFDKVTADDIVNAAEASGTVAITGAAHGDFVAGDVVTLTINNKSFTGTVNAQGVFSINVPGSDLVADSDKTIAVSMAAHDTAGNVGIITTNKAYIVDTTAPTTTVDITSISLDTGASSTDFITNDNNGLTIKANLINFYLSGVETVGTHTYKFRTTDVAGNVSAVTSKDLIVEALPTASTTSVTVAASGATVTLPTTSTAQAFVGNSGSEVFVLDAATISNYLVDATPGTKWVNAGAGVDTLRINGAGTTLNLNDLTTEYTNTKLQGFEIIDMASDTGNQVLVANATSLASMATAGWLTNVNVAGNYQLVIRGNTGDQLILSPGDGFDTSGWVKAHNPYPKGLKPLLNVFTICRYFC